MIRSTTAARRAVAAAIASILVAAGGASASATTTPDESAPAGMSAEEWDAIVEAANEEGKVTLYTAQSLDQGNNLKAAFEAEYPDITVDVVRDISSNLIPKLEAERQTGNGIADVYVSADTAWWQTTAADGQIIPMGGPNFAAPEYDSAELVHDGTYFEVSAIVFGYGWNTELVPDGLSDLTDVLDPEFEGMVGVVEPSLEALVDFYKYLEEQYGTEFVESLAEQSPRIYPGAGPMAEALAAGEIAVSTYLAPRNDLTDAGAPIEWTIPDTAWGARFYAGIVDSAPNPNAAQLLTNFMVGQAGQEALVFNESVAVLPGIEGTGAEIGDIRRAPTYTPEEVTEYQDTWRSLFQS